MHGILSVFVQSVFRDLKFIFRGGMVKRLSKMGEKEKEIDTHLFSGTQAYKLRWLKNVPKSVH